MRSTNNEPAGTSVPVVFHFSIGLAVTGLIALLGTPATASAQAGNGSGSRATLEEVVVVARKIDESQQSVPIAVSSVSEDTVRELNIRNVTDSLTLVPGTASNISTPSQQVHSIRGISSGSNSATADAGVLVMVDNEVISRSFMHSGTMYDVDRVEVLRGPQGTTYGRNSAGGVIHVLNRRPHQETEITADFNLGSHDLVSFDGVVNGALGERASGRLSIHFTDREGYFEDPETDRTLDDLTDYALRGQLLFDPADDWSILARAHYTKMELDNPGTKKPYDPSQPYDSPFTSYTDPSSDPWDVQNSLDTFYERDIWGLGLEVYKDFGTITLSSITSFRTGEDEALRDLFGTPGALLDEPSANDADTFAQELRLDNSAAGSRVTWLAGLFYLKEDHFRFEEKHVVTDTPAGTVQSFTQDNTTKSMGLFGEIDFAITDATHLSVGGRYSWDEKKFSAFHTTAGPLGFIFIPESDDDPVQGTVEEDWSKPTYRLTLTHAFDDNVMFYGSYATGYVAGGFNPEPSNLEALGTPFDEETLDTIEFGMKSELAGRRLRLNLAAFDSSFDDIQEEFFLPSGTLVTQNIAKASIRGVEIEGLWLANDYLEFDLAYANYDHEYDDFINSDGTDLGGAKLQDIPDWTLNAGAQLRVPMRNGSELRFRVDYRSRSDINEDAEQDPVWGIRPGTDIWNARLSLQSADSAWEVALWGRNLSKEEDMVSITTQAFMTQRSVTYGAPRTYGMSVRYAFQ